MSEDQNFVLEQIAKKVYSLSPKRNVRSAVWSILSEVIKDDGVVLKGYLYCLICDKLVKYSPKQLSNLNRHKCCQNLKDPKPKGEKLVTQADKKTAIDSCVAWITEDCQPFSAIDGSGFQRMAQFFINIGAKYGDNNNIEELLPDAYTLSRTTQNTVNETKNQTKNDGPDIFDGDEASMNDDELFSKQSYEVEEDALNLDESSGGDPNKLEMETVKPINNTSKHRLEPHRSSSKWNESSAGSSFGVSAKLRARKRGRNMQQRKRNASHSDDNGSANHDEDSYDDYNEHIDNDDDDDDGDGTDYMAAKKRRCQTSTDRETESECALIGKRMATHFRNMRPDQRLFAERIISEVLVYGRMNRLTLETRFLPDK
ncbi:uncharacterized protein [Drosophila tropicalis]|uniref:uncharacterized protein n=1 Tax=Drosophila tropicalis TaxID=46794 RepID=UPI0035ABD60E